MNRNDILVAIRRFFTIEELVCDHTYKKWGENAWQFLDTDFLHALLVIRKDIIKLPMWCNGRNAHQRGFRCNMCQMVKEKKEVYLSSHLLGKAGDFSIQGMKAEVARQKIKDNASLLPCPIRIEGGVSWLHFDVLPQYGVTEKVYEFKA